MAAGIGTSAASWGKEALGAVVLDGDAVLLLEVERGQRSRATEAAVTLTVTIVGAPWVPIYAHTSRDQAVCATPPAVPAAAANRGQPTA